jgi:CAAX protease family protein
MNTDIKPHNIVDQSENPSTRRRFWAMADLALITFVFLSVLVIGRQFEVIGYGSLAVVAAVLAGTLTMKIRGESWRDLGMKFPGSGRKWLTTIGLAGLTVVAVFALVPLIVLPTLEALSPGTELPNHASDFEFFFGRPLIFITYLVIIGWGGAAVGEEMFCRGLMMNRISEIFGSSKLSWVVALVSQAVFFGVLHSYQGAVGMYMVGLVGFVFGVFYLLGKRSLWPVIIAHGIVDTVGLSQLYFMN